MPVPLYMDVHIPRAITLGLRLGQVDVLTAQEDNAAQLPDPELLDRATALVRPLFTFDRDFLTEGARRQKQNIEFAGLIYAHSYSVSIRTCIQDLTLIARAGEPQELRNRIEFLPL